MPLSWIQISELQSARQSSGMFWCDLLGEGTETSFKWTRDNNKDGLISKQTLHSNITESQIYKDCYFDVLMMLNKRSNRYIGLLWKPEMTPERERNAHSKRKRAWMDRASSTVHDMLMEILEHNRQGSQVGGHHSNLRFLLHFTDFLFHHH